MQDNKVLKSPPTSPSAGGAVEMNRRALPVPQGACGDLSANPARSGSASFGKALARVAFR